VTPRSSRPLGAALSAAAAFVFATPTLFLPPDAHASVKLVFIVGGSILLATAVIRVRAENSARNEPDPGPSAPEGVTRD
jgi:hypothetical protein